jgi:hypothetical protein
MRTRTRTAATRTLAGTATASQKRPAGAYEPSSVICRANATFPRGKASQKRPGRGVLSTGSFPCFTGDFACVLKRILLEFGIDTGGREC